jgi:hypothetical protein
MDRRVYHLSLFIVLWGSASAFAQVGSVPPPPPEPMLMPGSTLPLSSQPAMQSTSPSAQPSAVMPPPGQPVLQPATPYVPLPAQSIYSPATPWIPAPADPSYYAPAPWTPTPSPGLGLVPGADNPRWDLSLDVLWLALDTGKGVPLGYTSYNFDPPPHAMRIYSLWSDDALFPLEPGIRLQLVARFTDRMAVEASCWGLQQWSVGRTIYGDPVGESVWAHSPWLQTSYLIGGFNDYLGYTESSRVANVEINQRFKLFSWNPYRAISWLWGFRYFYLSDDFTLSGLDLFTGDYESLNWQTNNNLIGMQLGLQWTWGWNRFQLSSEFKAGLFANAYSQHGVNSALGTAGFEPFDLSHSGTDLAAMFEFSLLLRFRITQSMWARAGYQYACFTGLALGPRQLEDYDSNGAAGLDGLSIGLEWTR